jgi:uncharacterized protein YbaR (Trm112 family)
MSTCQFDPAKEKAMLSAAITALEKSWGKPGMAQAVADLRTALAHAEHALSVLEHETNRDTAFEVHVLGLGFQVTYAREELDRAEQFAFDMLGQRRAREETPRNVLDVEFPAGTIVACPECGEGLYKTTTRVTTADLVLDDGTLLTPLNRTIPARDAWAPLACPVCGGRLLKDGQIHTVQQGWK